MGGCDCGQALESLLGEGQNDKLATKSELVAKRAPSRVDLAGQERRQREVAAHEHPEEGDRAPPLPERRDLGERIGTMTWHTIATQSPALKPMMI